MSRERVGPVMGLAGLGVFVLPILAIMMFIARMWLDGIVLLGGAAFCLLLILRASD